MQWYTVFLIVLSLIELTALLFKAKESKSLFLWAAAARIIIFTGVYLFILIYQPPIEVSRSVSRPLFVIMQGIVATAAIDYLRRRFKNKIVLIIQVITSRDVQ